MKIDLFYSKSFLSTDLETLRLQNYDPEYFLLIVYYKQYLLLSYSFDYFISKKTGANLLLLYILSDTLFNTILAMVSLAWLSTEPSICYFVTG